MQLTVADLDERVQRLLNELQNEIPLVERPYRVLGGKVGLSEEEVVEQIRRLKEEKILRQLSAIFDTRSLGYQSSLVAARAPKGREDQVAECLNEHPGISHNYARKHDFNLWFTIAVPGNSSLEEHIEVLKRKSGAESIRLLPTLHLFKIGMKIDATGKQQGDDESPIYSEKDRSAARPALAERDKEFVRALQEHMEVRVDPYAPVASRLGITQEALFAWCEEFKRQGRMRRMAGVMNHRRAGFRANGMGVWVVPPERAQEVGALFASVPAVTHCYLRPTYPDWPYNIFTMVHSQKTESCDSILAGMAQRSRLQEYATLYSYKEYKKIRLLLFTGEIAAWEKANGLKPGEDY